MHKQHLLRTPLIAVVGLLAFLVVPSAAQAHHVTSEAECELDGGVPTVKLDVKFWSFSSTKDVTGTIKLDGVLQKNVAPGDITWSGDNGSLSWTKATTGGQHTVTRDVKWPGKSSDKAHHTVTCETPPPNPNMTIEKDGPSTRYVGETAIFTLKVTNTGNVVLDPVVTDSKCVEAPVKVTPQSQFDPGDVWTYTCSAGITDQMGDELVNTACVEASGKKACDTHTTKIKDIKIAIEKTAVVPTAVAGATVNFTIAVTNPAGSTPYRDYVLDDAKCDEVRTGDTTDTTLDPGETWTYSCEMVTQVGQTLADNCATATGTNADDKMAGPVTDCAEIPLTQPPTVTTPTVNQPSSTPAPPSGGVLPETIVSGLASLRGPSGCVKQAFKARVTGRSIASVAFFVDGKLVKKFTTQRSSYSIKVSPKRFGFGRHKVIARVEFTDASGTNARRLPLTFRRCAQGAVAPRFTG